MKPILFETVGVRIKFIKALAGNIKVFFSQIKLITQPVTCCTVSI